MFLTDSYLVLVMEYAAGADLFRLVSRAKGLPEGEARWFFQQIMFAVDYSHKMVHRHAAAPDSPLRCIVCVACWRAHVALLLLLLLLLPQVGRGA